MLSKENASRIILTGLYKCKPNPKYRSSIYSYNLYHCFNWTFTPYYNEYQDKWYMKDTYFENSGYIELTDDNFNEFELIFDYDEVKSVDDKSAKTYDEYYRVFVDNSGRAKYYVKRNAHKNKEIILSKLSKEIKTLEDILESKRALLRRIRTGEIDWDKI